MAMFQELGFTTAWHLTDIENLESVTKYGLMSRERMMRRHIPFAKVGADKIVQQRKQWSEYVLTFVRPENHFVQGRIDNHLRDHPRSNGLCLIEIDLLSALERAKGETLISSGLLSKTTMKPKTEAIENFSTVLNWHAMLDRHADETEQIKFSRGAEILFPNYVSPLEIRAIWFPNSNLAERYSLVVDEKPCLVGTKFFMNEGPLPPPAKHNFTEWQPLEWTAISDHLLGDGLIVGKLGTRLVVNYSQGGTRLERFT